MASSFRRQVEVPSFGTTKALQKTDAIAPINAKEMVAHESGEHLGNVSNVTANPGICLRDCLKM